MDINEMFLNACKNGQKGVIQAFLKKGGIDFDKRDKYGNTCLMYVCLKGYKDITKLILENGADSNLANNESITPLHAVSENGNKEIAEMLLGAGADINATNKNGETPLMYAITEKNNYG
jgi:UNC-44 ankyrin